MLLGADDSDGWLLGAEDKDGCMLGVEDCSIVGNADDVVVGQKENTALGCCDTKVGYDDAVGTKDGVVLEQLVTIPAVLQFVFESFLEPKIFDPPIPSQNTESSQKTNELLPLSARNISLPTICMHKWNKIHQKF
jgi:hypothetical protein